MITSWFIPEKIQQDNEQFIKAKTVVWALGYTVSMSCAVAIYNYLFDVNTPFPFLPIIILVAGLLFLLKYTGRLFLVSNILVFSWASGLYLSALKAGGIFSQEVLTSLSIPLIAYLVLGIRMGTVWLITSVLFVCYLYFLSLDPARNIYFREQSLQLDNTFHFVTVLVTFCNIFIFFLSFHMQYTDLVKLLLNNQQQLKDKNEELEQFTYIASHDLKTPLRTVISFSGLLERNIKQEKYDDLLDNLQYVKTGAGQMYNLVNDILEYTKLDQELAEKSKVPINLQTIAEEVAQYFKKDSTEKELIIEIDDLPNYIGRKSDFLVIFQNLIENGLKYNKSKRPRVKIWAETTKKQLKINFLDNGIGIEQEYHEQIFYFFKRLHTKEFYDGTGLGLGLCKKIINQYNGEILVQSELGKGSLFTIVLPVG